MAKVYLESGDSFTISNNNTSVYGAGGTEVLTIASGVTGLTFDSNCERVALAGASSAYSYQQQGVNMVVYSGSTVVATIPLQTDTDGTQVTFTNGTVNAKIASGVMTFGGTTVVAGTSSSTATTLTASTIDTATTSSSSSSGSSSTATAYTFTTGVDVLSGSTGNDTYSGLFAAANATVTAADEMAGGSGTDTFNLKNTNSTALSAANLPTMSGVEVIDVSLLSGALAVTGSVLTDVTTLKITNPAAASAVTATAVKADLVNVTLKNIAVDANDLTMTWATTALTGTADAFNLTLDNALAATVAAANVPKITLNGGVAGAGFETVNIAVSSASSIEDLLVLDSTGAAGDTMTKLVITGAGAFTNYTALDFKGTTGTIDASGTSGGVTLSVATENLTITGGSGNDTIKFGTAGDLDASDSINMGSGTDKIVLADTAVSSSTTALNAAINASTAEVIGFSAAASVDMSYVTPSKVSMSSTTDVALTVTKLESTDTVIVDTGTNTAADLTVQGSLGYSTLNVELSGSSTASVQIDNLDATSQSTVNIVSNGSLATANILDNLNLSAMATVNISGSQSLTVTNALDNTAVKINGASMTGKLSVTAGTTASELIGGAGNDTLTGGTGADTITGGSGDDTINTGVDGAVGTTITGGAGADLITSGHIAASAATIAYNATAAESYAGATPTSILYADTLTVGNLADTGTTTTTFTTGVTPTSQTGSISVLAVGAPPTLGTTTVSNGGFVVYNSVAEADGVTAGNWMVFQDTDADGIIEQGEFAVKIVGTTDASDTEAFAVTSGKLVFTLTGA